MRKITKRIMPTIWTRMSRFMTFSKRLPDENFYIENYMKSFRPVSVDPERLFSLCRYSRNYLQCRMTVENHSRNVFISKNKSFMPE